MSNQSYFISTGSLTGFYTLRTKYDDMGRSYTGETYLIPRNYHIKNLSTNREEAVAKANAYADKMGIPELYRNFKADFDLNTIGRRSEIDWSILQGGKYAGQSLHEVYEIDPEYLIWICENMATSKQYEKTVELAKSLLENLSGELKARADAKASAQEAWEDRVKLNIEMLKPIIEAMSKGSDWCASVARDLERGFTVSPKCADICLDVYAKQFGRRGSKKYQEALDKIDEEALYQLLTVGEISL